LTALLVVGAQWGDEGKGKVVDVYARHADLVVRFGGGANAGHTLVVDGEQLVFHLVPAGALHGSARCVLAHGAVVDPAVLLHEIETLRGHGLDDPQRLFVSERAFLVLPQHMLLDELREARQGAIGTTRRGIGPAYEDKVARRGLRVGDLLDRDRFARKLTANLEAWAPVITALGGTPPDHDEIVERYTALGAQLAPLIGDAGAALRTALRSGKRVLLEGNQGAMLDLDGGTYPFVTSTSTVAGGAAVGAGIGPTQIGNVVGISKAYTTRVGNGPFPTELHGEEGVALREAGSEFGATTGRPRRCGWLDAVALRYAVDINGMTGLAFTKLDVLTGMPELRICTAYEREGVRLDAPPYDDLDGCQPVYETLPGWTEPIDACRRLEDLPANARAYVQRVTELVGCPIWMVSVGADREAVIAMHHPFD
jgi:adenylosuccinate synthase